MTELRQNVKMCVQKNKEFRLLGFCNDLLCVSCLQTCTLNFPRNEKKFFSEIFSLQCFKQSI
jgi:hypothetical protein